MHQKGDGNEPEGFEDQKCLSGENAVGDEKAIGDASQHLRPSQRDKNSIMVKVGHIRWRQPPEAEARIPATMLAAPNRMKQPRMTIAPWRQLILPVSIMKPTDATAITATIVAKVPRSVPCNQFAALMMTLEP
jgi:hypothetical protein